MSRFTAVVLAILTCSSVARADDEGSEHTTTIVGAAEDPNGVITKYDETSGWSMRVRAKPGSDEKTITLAVPNTHAHYIVYVSPKRSAITWIETSAGIDRDTSIDVKRTLAWVYSPDGKLLRTWTYGKVFTTKQLAAMPRSVSHVAWMADFKTSTKGLDMVVRGAKRTVHLDPKATTLR